METIKEYFQLAWRNLRSRSLRSWLTILGIVIGVFLIIALLSVSEGIKTTINQQLRALGSEIIFVMPGGFSDITSIMAMYVSGARLERVDIDAIKRTSGVETVLLMSYSALPMRYKGESKTVFMIGQPWDEGVEILAKFRGWSLAEGRWPISGRREIVVGYQVAKAIFKEKVEINSEATIKGRKFIIVGTLNSLGSKTDDSAVYLDLSLFQEITGEQKGTAQMAMVKIQDGQLLSKVAEDLKNNLQETRKRRIGTDEADFSVITSDTMQELTSSILAIIQFAVFIFASIAIVVGGIGITNTMFTSVRERTREIGIMKAVGAKNSTVLLIFLIEAGIIGLAGGLGGTILGIIFNWLIVVYGQIHPLFYFSFSVGPGLIIFGLTFSFLVGCLAGLFPARRAAKLRPVEALRRYE
ncbi:MAG: ABC transporter permease [Minisyncoccales bacterium]